MGDEDDDYVTIGTPFELPDDVQNAPLKKQSKVSDQIVVDKQGRRRFHGAFTGGFSAGYFNTVGSKEGWTPSTFKSSKNSKKKDADDDADDDVPGQNKQRFQQRPEDFMDDDDFSEHGIAPRKLKTTSNFTSTEDELNSRKRQIKQHINENEEQTASDLLLDELILPTKLSIGIQILKKMGWKPGQGVGEKDRTSNVPEPVKGKKVYGCMRPEATDCMDMSAFKKLLAPKDVVQVSFTRKDNFHGIGYSGLDPATAMFGSGGYQESKSFKPTGKEKRGIKGQAFGVGAFEDDDNDIYGVDNLSNYDISMSMEDEHNQHGWSGAPKMKQNKGCLSGFEKCSKVLKALSNQKMITIPSSYIPKHTFPSKNDDSTGAQNDGDKSNKTRLTSKERGLMFGETVKTLDDVNNWSLKWDDRPAADDDGATGKAKTADSVVEPQEKSNKFSSRWDKEINQVRPKIINKPPATDISDESKPKKEALMYDVKSKTFRPFAKNPEKQARYEEFVKAKKENRDPVFQYDTSVTEWERQRERDEFTRASILYRPLNSMFANRFTPATSVDPQNVTLQSAMGENLDGSKDSTFASSKDSVGKDDLLSDDMKAAKMGMYGKLTRSVHQWHPDKLLCKRFNIPDPYPGSKIRGVPDRARKSKSGSFFERDFLSIAMSSNENDKNDDIEEEDDDFASRMKNDNQKTKLQKKTLKIGPLAHLNRKLGAIDTDSKGADSITESLSQITSNNESTTGKPSIDIFKAIFDDSDSSSSDSENDENSKEIDKPAQEIDDRATTPQVESKHTNITDQTFGQLEKAYRPKIEGPLAFLNETSLEKSTNENNFVRSESIEKENVSSIQSGNRIDTLQSVNDQFQNKKTYRRSDIDRREEKKDSKRSYDDEWTERDNRADKKRENIEYGYSSSESDDDRKRHKSSKSSKKKHKHNKKEKKHKKKSKKSKKKKNRGNRNTETESDSESEDNVSLVPSNASLLEKLKEIRAATGKRPTAADFM